MQHINIATNGARTSTTTTTARMAHPLPQLRPTGMRLSAAAPATQAPASVIHTPPRLSGHVGPQQLKIDARRVIDGRRTEAEANVATALDLLRRVEPLLREAAIRDSIEGPDHIRFVKDINQRYEAVARRLSPQERKKELARALRAVQTSAELYREVWTELEQLESLVQDIHGELILCEAELARVLADVTRLESGDMRLVMLLARSA